MLSIFLVGQVSFQCFVPPESGLSICHFSIMLFCPQLKILIDGLGLMSWLYTDEMWMNSDFHQPTILFIFRPPCSLSYLLKISQDWNSFLTNWWKIIPHPKFSFSILFFQKIQFLLPWAQYSIAINRITIKAYQEKIHLNTSLVLKSLLIGSGQRHMVVLFSNEFLYS